VADHACTNNFTKTQKVAGWRLGSALQTQERIRTIGADMKRKKPRSTDELTTLDDLLKEEGRLEEFEAVAIKEVLAWQIAEAMKAQNLS
jgi:hypothetical protein